MKSVSRLTFLAAVGFCVLAAGPARAAPTYTFFTLTFDENGNCTSTFMTCPSTTGTDPTGFVTGQNVLIYTLPELTFSGRVDILDAGGSVSDQLAFVDTTTGSTTTCEPGSGAAICANELIFYSFDSLGTLADVGSRTISVITPALPPTENANGTFEFFAGGCPAGAPNCNNYIGTSAGTVPIPAALPLFATGLGGLGLLGWRRKRKAQAGA
jgi:hypothetical protein